MFFDPEMSHLPHPPALERGSFDISTSVVLPECLTSGLCVSGLGQTD